MVMMILRCACLALTASFLLAQSAQPAFAEDAKSMSAATLPAKKIDVAGLTKRSNRAKKEGDLGLQNVLTENLADQVDVTFAGGHLSMDKQHILDQGLAEFHALKNTMPDFTSRITEVTVQGDVVTVAYTWKGTMPDGSKLIANKHTIMTVGDGRVAGLQVQEDPNADTVKTIRSIFRAAGIGAPAGAKPK
jgi:ketosteroid isomerase-like protein